MSESDAIQGRTGLRPVRVLVYVLAAVAGVLLLGLAALAWLLTDEDRLRDFAERSLTGISGRAFVVQGDFSVELGRQITLRAGDIRWANTPSSPHDTMLRAGQLTVAVDALSVLRPPVRITAAQATDGEILLEWLDGAPFNWVFKSGGEPATEVPAGLPLHLAQAQLDDVRIVISHPGLKDQLQLDVTTLQHAEDAEHRLVLNGVAEFGERQLDLNAAIGPFPDLIVGGAVDFFIDITGPYAELVARGRSPWLADLDIDQLDATLRAPDTREFLTALQLPGATTGPTELRASLNSSRAGTRALLNGNVGEFAVDANLTVADLLTLQDFELGVRSSGPSLKSATALAGLSRMPDEPYTLDIRARRTSAGLLIEKLALDTKQLKLQGDGIAEKLPAMSDLTLNLQLSGGDLASLTQLMGVDVASVPFTVAGSIKANPDGDDALAFDMTIGSATATLQGSLGLERSSGATDLNFDGTFAGSDLAGLLRPLLPDTAATGIPPLKFRVPARLGLGSGRLDIDIDDMTLGNSRLAFNGNADFSNAAWRMKGQLSASGQRLEQLLGHSGLKPVPPGTFEFSTALNVTPREVALSQLRFAAAGAELGGTVGVGLGESPRISFDINARGPNFASFLPATQNYRAAEVPFRISTKGLLAASVVAIDDLNADLGAARLDASGQINLTPEFSARNVSLTASGPRLSDLGMPGDWQLLDAPFDIAIAGAGSNNELLLKQLSFKSGNNDLTGRVRIEGGSAEQKPFFDIELSSRRLDLDEIRKPVDRDLFAATASSAPKKGLFNDDPLPLDILDRFDGELDLNLDELATRQLAVEALSARASLKDSALNVEKLGITLPVGVLRASGSLRREAEEWALTARMQANQATFQILGAGNIDPKELPRHSIDAQVSARGNSTRTMAATANGYAWLIGGSGKTPALQFGPLVGDFATELLGKVNPFTKSRDYLVMQCEGLYFEITNGVVETAPQIVSQNDLVVITAVGKVNLTTEAIDFTFQTTPRKGIGVSLSDVVNPFTRVAGTLSKPQIALNTSGAVVEGGAAVATGGMTILAKSLWKRWFGSKELCSKTAERAAEIRRDRDPTAVPDLAAMTAVLELEN